MMFGDNNTRGESKKARALIAPSWSLASLVPLLAGSALASPLSSQQFAPGVGVTQSTDGPWSVFVEDLDGDGDSDVLVASAYDDKVTWYKNLGGGVFGPQQTITNLANGAYSVYAADLDGDSDLDVLCGSSNVVSWYENVSGLGTFGPQKTVTTTAATFTAVRAADFDGDGDTDIVASSWSNNNTIWCENIDGLGTFGPPNVLATSTFGANSVETSDIDGDGDLDIVEASAFDPKIVWYRNQDGFGTFGPALVVSIAADDSTAIHPSDLDGDGDVDILSTDGNRIAWYENTDGLGNFGPQQIITPLGNSSDIATVDIDGDGDQDVLASPLEWYENLDGLGSFGPPISIDMANYANAIASNDFDGDGDNDVLSCTLHDDRVAWYANSDGLGNFGPQQVITNSVGNLGYPVLVDLDGDGAQDILSPAPGRIVWFKNVDSLGTFDVQKLIALTPTNYKFQLSAGDFDGDGDNDVIAGFDGSPSQIVWYENTDGLGSFGPLQSILPAFWFSFTVYWVSPADLDGDGDQDVLSAVSGPDRILWFENTDGLGSFAYPQTISSALGHPTSLFNADLDGDGDQDVLSTSFNDNKVAWYENTDGKGMFGPQTVISTAFGARSVFCEDFDGDGDLDVLWASSVDSFYRIGWQENTDGQGVFGPQEIITATAEWPEWVFAADLDADGDQDVLSASSGDGTFAWYENRDGLGDFGPQNVIATASDGAVRIIAADLNGDGDQDIVAGAYGEKPFAAIAWYENLHTTLKSSVDTVSVGAGGTQQLQLSAGIGSQFQPYLLLGSLSGTTPGISSAGFVLPLNPDFYFNFTLKTPNSPPLANSLGILDSGGRASAAFQLPAGMSPSLAGASLHHAYAAFDLTLVPGIPIVTLVSNAVPLVLQP